MEGIQATGSAVATPSAPRLHFLISVCEPSDAEVWMSGPGSAVWAHWHLADPAATSEDFLDRRSAFRRELGECENRVRLFMLLRDDQGGERSRFVQSCGAPAS